jgi:putative hydroxymethylpyrimidine transport system ATP-binding protein
MTPARVPTAAPSPAPSVHLRGVGLRYQATTVFEGLDLVLPGGRTTCLLGPSGIGKSSLLRLIAGLAFGAEGVAADQHGRSLAGRVSYLAQQDLLLPWRSVLDNVLLGPDLRGEGRGVKPVSTARDLLARVGLAGSETLRPAQLSGGMRQRVALARTLMEDRAIVLMDEPFSALDAITRFELQALAANLLHGRTVLLVTHDPLEALRLGHEVRVMAGAPARLERALAPAGEPPRNPADPALLALQAQLLESLSQARGAATGQATAS